MTAIELSAIAVAASIGFSNPNSPRKVLSGKGTPLVEKNGYKIPAATGIRITLYRKAQKIF